MLQKEKDRLFGITINKAHGRIRSTNAYDISKFEGGLKLQRKIFLLFFIFAAFFVACSNEQTFDSYFVNEMEDMHQNDDINYSLIHKEQNVVLENDAIAIFKEDNLRGEQIFIAYFEREDGKWNWRQTRGAEWDSPVQWSSMHVAPYIYSGTINDNSIFKVYAGEELAKIIEVDGDKRFWYAISPVKAGDVKIVKKDGTEEILEEWDSDFFNSCDIH